MKYFFLADGWTYGRVWEFGGLWDQASWQRKPKIKRLNCGTVQQGQTLWLHEVEDAVLMVEVQPMPDSTSAPSIGQVVLKRLISAEQVIEILTKSELAFNSKSN